MSKTDGIDAELLLRTLLAWLRGEPRVCSMVPIPAEADEDARRRMREREELLAERVGLVNRIGAILPTLGVGEYNPIRRDRRLRFDELRTALGGSLPTHARAKIVVIARLQGISDDALAATDRRFNFRVPVVASQFIRPCPSAARTCWSRWVGDVATVGLVTPPTHPQMAIFSTSSSVILLPAMIRLRRARAFM